MANQITGKVDVLVRSETKFDASFPIDQFKVPGFSTPFRRDRDQYVGGFLAFIKEDIPAKHLSSESTPIEGIYVELNFRKKNWLLCCTYKIITTDDENGKILNLFLSNVVKHLKTPESKDTDF